MRVCDFCQSNGTGFVPATTSVSIGEIEVFDSCESCAQSIKELLTQTKEEKKSGPGRPRKAA